MTGCLKILKIFAILLSVVLVITETIVIFKTNFNIGIVMIYLLAAVIFSIAVLPNNKAANIYRAVVGLAVLIYGCLMLFLYLYKPVPTDNSEQAVIILGCAVIGDIPSKAMHERVLAASEYYTQNPNAYFVLSGGQGPQENLTEAKAMEKLMLGMGVPADRLILEEHSTSTYENFAYSKLILDEKFNGTDYKIAYVTNDFHTYRAGKVGELNGFNNISCISAKTPKTSAFVCYVREVLAVVKLWIMGN